jgi:hypothetical protein
VVGLPPRDRQKGKRRSETREQDSAWWAKQLGHAVNLSEFPVDPPADDPPKQAPPTREAVNPAPLSEFPVEPPARDPPNQAQPTRAVVKQVPRTRAAVNPALLPEFPVEPPAGDPTEQPPRTRAAVNPGPPLRLAATNEARTPRQVADEVAARRPLHSDPLPRAATRSNAPIDPAPTRLDLLLHSPHHPYSTIRRFVVYGLLLCVCGAVIAQLALALGS